MVAHELYKVNNIRHEAATDFSFLTEDELFQNSSLECFHRYVPISRRHIMTMRFRTSLVLRATNDEMFGYLAEQDFSFEVESIEKDIFDIEAMLERFYANVSIHIQGNTPTDLDYKPNTRMISAKAVCLLEDEGWYVK